MSGYWDSLRSTVLKALLQYCWIVLIQVKDHLSKQPIRPREPNIESALQLNNNNHKMKDKLTTAESNH